MNTESDRPIPGHPQSSLVEPLRARLGDADSADGGRHHDVHKIENTHRALAILAYGTTRS